MRYAIISDVHANEAALRAVLTDAADARADKIICLGDVLGYGPDPVAALELVYRRAHVCLAGNHDDAVSNRFSTEDFTDFAAAAVERHRKTLSQEAIDWLRCLPYTCEFDDFACTHGDFSDPKHFNYILEPQDAMPSWEERSEQLLFVGHTHQPGIFVIGASGTPHRLDAADFTLEDGKRYIVNTGSVGYPRSGVCRSCYCIYDDRSRTVFFRTLPFDLDSYAAKMHGQGLNEAPWMLARAAERRRPAVRGNAQFGVSKPVVENHPILTPHPPQAVLVDQKHDDRYSPRRTIITLACLIAAVVVACTVLLIRVMSKSDVCVPVVSSSAPTTKLEETPRFGQAIDLAYDWKYSLEDPARQQVSLHTTNGKRVFRIEHKDMHTVRFTRRLELQPQTGNVFWDVGQPSGDHGVKLATHLEFLDAAGVRLDGGFDSGKQPTSDKSRRVPVNATQAVFFIDCLCNGTYELPMPYFSVRPRQSTAAPRQPNAAPRQPNAKPRVKPSSVRVKKVPRRKR